MAKFKKTAMKWIEKHKEWWTSFTSTFVGSLLGIGITFGITYFMQHQQQKDMSRKLLITTMCDIDDECNVIDEKCSEIARVDSVFALMYVYYQMQLRNIHREFPKDKIKDYYALKKSVDLDRLAEYDEHVENRFNLKSFSTNAEVISIFDDLSVVDAIKKIYKLIDEYENLIKALHNIKVKILNYDDKHQLNQPKDIYKDFIKYQFQFNSKKRSEALQRFNYYNVGLQALNRNLKLELAAIMGKLNLDDRDIKKAKSEIADISKFAFPILENTNVLYNRHMNGIMKPIIESIKNNK